MQAVTTDWLTLRIANCGHGTTNSEITPHSSTSTVSVAALRYASGPLSYSIGRTSYEKCASGGPRHDQ